jgi:hypothetical protein
VLWFAKAQTQGKKMAQKHYKTLINGSTDAAGSAEFTADDYSRISLALATVGGSCVCKYKITLYPTPDTADAQAVTYADTTGSSAAAVAYFDNLADAQGVPFAFYKLKIEWSALANGGLVGAVAAY